MMASLIPLLRQIYYKLSLLGHVSRVMPYLMQTYVLAPVTLLKRISRYNHFNDYFRSNCCQCPCGFRDI
jgi:hypothetical protein